MSEQKPERKVVGRTVAIVLGIICIILAVGLVGAIADYTSIISGKDNTITTLTNQNNQLNTWLNGNKTLLDQTERWLDENKTLLSQTKTWLEGNITYYNSQITILQNQKSQLETWLNGNETNYEAQISSLNAKISQLQTWLNGNITSYTSQINSLNSQLNSLNSQYSTLNSSYNTLNAQYASLQDQLTGVLGIKNGTWLAYLDKLAIINYSYTTSFVPLIWTFTGTIDVYNYGANCTANILVYGPDGNTYNFNLSIPAGYTEFLEIWQEYTYGYPYPSIKILDAQR
jgi:chaperonin cofactor prefoldin